MCIRDRKKSAAERNYTFDQGTKLVLDSLNRFSPKIAEYASRVFNENHIDYSLRHGKRDGAFCSTPLPYITPFVLINYTGKSRDVLHLHMKLDMLFTVLQHQRNQF